MNKNIHLFTKLLCQYLKTVVKFDIIFVGVIMEKKKLFKNKAQMVIYTITFIICIILFIIIGKTDFKKNEDTPSKKFSSLYTLVDKDNLYDFSNSTDVINVLSGRSGIILMGFPSNSWTNYYAKYLNDVCKELEVDKIYYYDFYKDRKESNGTYETIVNKLSMYVPVNDIGVRDIQAPTIVVVKNGEIIGYFDDASIIKGTIQSRDYFNDYEVGYLKNQLRTAIKSYME